MGDYKKLYDHIKGRSLQRATCSKCSATAGNIWDEAAEQYICVECLLQERDDLYRRLGEAECRIESDARVEAELTAERDELKRQLEDARFDKQTIHEQAGTIAILKSKLRWQTMETAPKDGSEWYHLPSRFEEQVDG